MESRTLQAMHEIESICEHWSLAAGHMEKLAPLAYVWHPTALISKHPTKPYGLTLQAITHGNEVGGLEVLLSLLGMLRSGLLQPQFSLGFALGNPAAAAEDRRFLERDLNRSFGQSASSSLEEKRARELEPMLEGSQFFLDIHQTIEPSTRPFFIFPYTVPSFAFAQAISGGVPIVTHWGSSFSKDGMCSDEFVNQRGGVGITLELGQKGFNPYHRGVGVLLALAAIEYAGRMLKSRQASRIEARDTEVYTWKAVVAHFEGAELNEGLYNFQHVSSGETLGRTQDGLLRAQESGYLLFPKYRRDPNAPAPKELYRIAERIRLDQLGKEGVMRR